MTKTELVGAIATKAGISKAAAEKALKAFTDGVAAALKKGDKVSLVGFGSFEVTKRAARKGRNPQTGAAIKIKASKSPKFRPGASLKKAVNR
jgi:DNA-binding protein HU-beta